MLKQEGVRKVTSRLLEMKKLKDKLKIAKTIVAVCLAINLSLAFFVLNQDEDMPVENKKKNFLFIESNKNSNEKKSFKEKIMNAPLDLEELALKETELAKKEINGELCFKNKVATDIKYNDFILDEGIIRSLENNKNLFVIFADSKESMKALESKMLKEYYLGTERYLEAILEEPGIVLIKFSSKEVMSSN